MRDDQHSEKPTEVQGLTKHMSTMSAQRTSGAFIHLADFEYWLSG